MYKYFFPIVLYFSIWQNLLAQRQVIDGNPDKSLKYQFIDIRLHSGLVINNYIHMDSFPARKPSALLEIKFGKQTIGDKKWQQYFGYPQVNLSLVGGYLGNNPELGYTIGIVPNITLNAFRDRKWSIRYNLGLGFTYFNRPYDVIKNKHNILIGSHITNLSFAQFDFWRILSENTDLNFGLEAIHASNGHYQLPNVGMNMVSAHLGIKYYFNKRPYTFYKQKDSSLTNNLNYGLRFGVGVHEFGNELGPVKGSKYPVLDFAFYTSTQAGKLGKAMVGVGYKYYSSFYSKMNEDTINYPISRLRASCITLFLAYEFEMGQVSFIAEGGINVYNPYWKRFTELIHDQWTFYKQLEGLISTRLGLQYYLLNRDRYKNNIYLGIYIKANMGGADFASVATGFVFK
jgi:hypothetical protein